MTRSQVLSLIKFVNIWVPFNYEGSNFIFKAATWGWGGWVEVKACSFESTGIV